MKRIIATQGLHGEREGICELCGAVMIWRDMYSENFNNGEPDQQDDGYWEHECARDVLLKRELGLIEFIQTNARIKGMSSMVEHPKYSLLISIQDKLYKPEEK